MWYVGDRRDESSLVPPFSLPPHPPPPQPTLAAGNVSSGFCSSQGTASPWTESSVHVGLAFFPDSLLPPPVAATGSYVLALDRASEGTPGLWSLLCEQLLEQMDLLLAVLRPSEEGPCQLGPALAVVKGLWSCFLFDCSPLLLGASCLGVYFVVSCWPEKWRGFSSGSFQWLEEFSFFCSCDHNRLSLYCLTNPDHGVTVYDMRTCRCNEGPPCVQIS